MPGSKEDKMLVKVADKNDVADGQMLVVDIGGTEVSLAGVDGQVFAFDDTCTHQGCSLASGELDGTTVTCPCHGAQFDVTSGAVLRGPAGRPVRSRSVQIQGEDVLVES
jgi:nitrite reductase/ring-hydroxylating ferredoxin subunit